MRAPQAAPPTPNPTTGPGPRPPPPPAAARRPHPASRRPRPRATARPFRAPATRSASTFLARVPNSPPQSGSARRRPAPRWMHEAPQRNLRWSRSTAAMNARNTGPPAPRQTIPAAKEHELKTLKVPANPAQQRNNEGLNFAGRSCEYRYRDSNPGFRRERASEHPAASRKSPYFQGKYDGKEPPDTPNLCEMFGSGSDGGACHAVGLRLRASASLAGASAGRRRRVTVRPPPAGMTAWLGESVRSARSGAPCPCRPARLACAAAGRARMWNGTGRRSHLR